MNVMNAIPALDQPAPIPDRTVPDVHPLMTPFVFAVPLQLLAYHIAVLRNCDVDQPRNLVKSLTVE